MMAHEGAFKCFELRLMLSFILSALSMYGANDHAYVLWCVHVYQSIYREARSLARSRSRSSLFLSSSL